MNSNALKSKLHTYIDSADNKKLRAIFTLIEDDIDFESIWDDPNFVKEIEIREKAYLNGTSKMFTNAEALAQVKQTARKVRPLK